MPYWNEELQQWGFLYHESYSPSEWWGIRRETVYPINDQEQAQIENSFTYHSPKPDQIPRYGKLRDMAKELAIEIHKSVPPGRYRSLAITALEDCIMRANKGIACGE